MAVNGFGSVLFQDACWSQSGASDHRTRGVLQYEGFDAQSQASQRDGQKESATEKRNIEKKKSVLDYKRQAYKLCNSILCVISITITIVFCLFVCLFALFSLVGPYMCSSCF